MVQWAAVLLPLWVCCVVGASQTARDFISPATASAGSDYPLHVQDGKVDWGTQGKDAAKTYGEGFKVCQLQSMAAL